MVNKVLNASSYLELNLKECGKEHCIASKVFSFTPKTYYLWHYVLDGGGTYTIYGTTYELHAGDLFYIGPGDEPRYTPSPKNPWTYIWLGFDGSNAKVFMRLMGLSLSSPIIHDEGQRYRPYFERLYDKYMEAGYFDLTCLGLAYELIGLMSHDRSIEDVELTTGDAHIKAAKEFILNNYQFHITVNDIAKNVNISANYMDNLFARHNEHSPKQFLIDTRMKNAVLLLRTGVYKINEVAKKVGYPNQLHFSNEFKRYYGVSPAFYCAKEDKENALKEKKE
jgi:AraC-like DNA-binding protein